ncbi:CoA transferase [Galactobacter valiniphilus]|uniref:CoA transferase n=1 Tax=Galactobacter valiniphilus TaxID=2676122 RepID=UPI003735002D
MSARERTVPDDGGLAAALALAGARGGDPGRTPAGGEHEDGPGETTAPAGTQRRDRGHAAGSPSPDPLSDLLPGREAIAAVQVTGPRRWWGGPLDVEGLALGSSRLAAAALARLIGRPGALSLRSERVAAAFDSFRLLRVGGEPVRGFAPLSRFWPCADGWLRTHANYPHHRERLLAALGLGEGSGPEAVGAALARLTAAEAEHRIVERGGVAAAVRSRTAWEASAAGVEASLFAQAPLRLAPAVSHTEAEPWRPEPRHARAPLSGLRVVDLSRVIAGPTASRTLAALGADVLRLDPPALPELRDQYLDTDTGKRRASVDLRAEAARIHALLAEAHVVITGYRPGSLEALGFGPAQLALRHPHLAVASLSAWGPGPWAERRGFDSIVQAANGIALEYRDGHGHPGALPVQALDHATGQLLVAGLASLLWARLDTAAGSSGPVSASSAQDGGTAPGHRPGGLVTAALAHTAEALWALGAHRDTAASPTDRASAVESVSWRPEAGGPEVLAAPSALDLDGAPAAPETWSLSPADLAWNEGLAADTVSAPTVDP